MKRLLKVIVMFTSLLSIVGCANKTPSCADDKTVSLVKQLFINAIHDSIEQDKAHYRTIAPQLGAPQNGNQQRFGFLDNLASKISDGIQISVNTIRVSNFDEKINKYSCEAEIAVNLPPNLQKTADDIRNRNLKPEMRYDLIDTAVLGFKWVEHVKGIDNTTGAVLKQDVEFTSQLTEGKDEQLVEMRGHQPLVEMIAALGAIDALSAPKSPTGEAAAPPAMPAPVNQSEQAATPTLPIQPVQEQSVSESEILKKYNVSFDCNKASTTVEKLTCSTDILSQLDGLLAATYKDRMNDPAFGVDKKIFKADQLKWAKTKNACTNTACLEKSYRNRISELCGMPVVSGVHPEGDCDSIQN